MTSIAWAVMFCGIMFNDAANMYIAHSNRYDGSQVAACIALSCLFMCLFCSIAEIARD
jgi:hypothetical protein